MKAPDVRIIAAVGRRGQLGLDGSLPWIDPDDLRWFRQQTTAGYMIAGPKTYEPLSWRGASFNSGRTLLKDDFKVAPAQFLAKADIGRTGEIIWIIGGAKTYQRWLASGLVRIAVITLIDYDGPADIWMPPIWNSDRDSLALKMMEIIGPRPENPMVADFTAFHKARMYDRARAFLYPDGMP